MRSLACVMVGLLLGAAAPALTYAMTHERVAAVTNAIRSQLHSSAAQVHAGGARMMPQCLAQLAVSWLSGTDEYKTVAVRCSQPPWTLYVGLSVPTVVRVPVIIHAVPGGHIVPPQDVAYKTLPIDDLNGQAITPFQINEGVTSRVTLLKGTPLTESDVDIPVAVRVGEPVSLVSNTEGITVETAGSALQNGGYGQKIVVQNDETHRRVMAILAPSAPALKGLYAVPNASRN